MNFTPYMIGEIAAWFGTLGWTTMCAAWCYCFIRRGLSQKARDGCRSKKIDSPRASWGDIEAS